MKPVNTVFIGSSYEGKEILKSLNNKEEYNVTGVITQSDKTVGRKKVLTHTDIKSTALNLGIEVFEPDGKEENYEEIIEKTKPELVICIGFGEFIPKIILEYPRYRCLNIHYSLLPKLRGACPVQAAILSGLGKTGVSIQIMEEKMDVGPIIGRKEMGIEPKETTVTLKEKLIPAGHNLLFEILPKWIKGEIQPKEQDHSKSTYCYKNDISKENAEISWENEEPEQTERKVRALLPWPVAWTMVDEKRLKIFEAELVEDDTKSKPGEILSINNEPAISTKDQKTKLKLLSVQMEGKSRMLGREFLQGFRI